MPDTHRSEPILIRSPIKTLKTDMKSAWSDILNGLKCWRIWLALSWQEFRSTYRRSLVGVAWIMISFAAFTFIKLTIFSSLLDVGVPGYYDAYLVVGFFVWFYLSQSISASPDAFTSATGWIRSEPLPMSLYVFKAIMREFYGLALTLVVVIAALFYLRFSVNIIALASLPGILFLMLNAFSMKLLLGTVSARFRDLSHLVKATILPMMFVTPIFWLPSQMEALMKYLWWNPLFHYIEIVRAPILDGTIPITSWIFVGVLFLLLSAAGLLIFARSRQRIVFWF